MKSILILCAVTLAVIAVVIWRATGQPNRYGAFTAAPKAEVARLIESPNEFLGKNVQIEGRISEQCKTMGCYFFFRSGNQTLRVDLQAIAMKAPMREGHDARVEGQLVPYGGVYELYASAVEFE